MANETKLANVVKPQVLADMIAGKLTNKMVFAPVTIIDRTLEGRPGNVLTFPAWGFIGEAGVVNEMADISISQMSATTTTATIHKLGKGVVISDEAALSGYGDPLGEAASQIALALDGGMDSEIYAALHAIPSSGNFYYTCASTRLSADDVNGALTLFGEEQDGEKYLFVNPNDYAALRKASAWLPASEIAADRMVRGAVGMIYGCVVVLTNKCTSDDESFIVKAGAFRTVMKRDVLVETARNIVNKSTTITGDVHEVQYQYDATGAIRLVKNS